MVELSREMDEHSRSIKIDGKFVGFYNWHPGRSPSIVLHTDSPIVVISVADMAEIMRQGAAELLKHRKG